jgi:hypothetical protein
MSLWAKLKIMSRWATSIFGVQRVATRNRERRGEVEGLVGYCSWLAAGCLSAHRWPPPPMHCVYVWRHASACVLWSSRSWLEVAPVVNIAQHRRRFSSSSHFPLPPPSLLTGAIHCTCSPTIQFLEPTTPSHPITYVGAAHLALCHRNRLRALIPPQRFTIAAVAILSVARPP